jgi:hypothetical protein
MEADQIIEASVYAIVADFIAMLPRIGMALCLLALTWLVIALANRGMQQVLKRTRMRRALADLVIEIADVGIWVVALFIAAAVAFPSVTPANIMTGLGLGTVAIGFAFRDIFENFLAGVLILYREPFRLGDCIECAKIEGFVEEITARDTHLRQTDGQRVVLPNAMLFKNPATVRTDKDIRRTTIFCRLAFGVRCRCRAQDPPSGRRVARHGQQGERGPDLRTCVHGGWHRVRSHVVDRIAAGRHPPFARPGDRRRDTGVGRGWLQDRDPAPYARIRHSTGDLHWRRVSNGRGEGIAQVRRRAGESGGRRSPELLNRHTNPGE